MQCIVTVILCLAMVGPLSVQCQGLSSRLEGEENLVQALIKHAMDLGDTIRSERRSLFKFEKRCTETESQVEQLLHAKEQLTSQLNEAKLSLKRETKEKQKLEEELRKINSEVHNLHEENDELSQRFDAKERLLFAASVELKECSLNLAKCCKMHQEPGQAERPVGRTERGSNTGPPEKTFGCPRMSEE